MTGALDFDRALKTPANKTPFEILPASRRLHPLVVALNCQV